MAVNISAWSIRQPLPSIMLSVILLVLGWMSFMKLPVTRLDLLLLQLLLVCESASL